MLLTGAACTGGGHAHKLTAAGRSSTTTTAAVQAGDQATSTTGAAATVAPPTTATVAPKPRPTPTTAKSSAPTPTTEAPNLSNDNMNIVVVTEADSGKTFTLHRGNQGIEVQLSSDNVWTEPQASNAQVLTRTDGSTNSDGSAHATFMATGDGTSTVSADGRSHPLPCQTANPPCMVPDHIVHFQVTVNVVG